MDPFVLYAVCSVLLFGIALHGFLAQNHLVRKVVALNLLGSSIFLFLITVAFRNRLGDEPDPVPHAMVLTGIVVAVSITAFALALVRRYYTETGRVSLPLVRREGPVGEEQDRSVDIDPEVER
jgi:multicomponent Na+:H+ antiporter subunit C